MKFTFIFCSQVATLLLTTYKHFHYSFSSCLDLLHHFIGKCSPRLICKNNGKKYKTVTHITGKHKHTKNDHQLTSDNEQNLIAINHLQLEPDPDHVCMLAATDPIAKHTNFCYLWSSFIGLCRYTFDEWTHEQITDASTVTLAHSTYVHSHTKLKTQDFYFLSLTHFFLHFL